MVWTLHFAGWLFEYLRCCWRRSWANSYQENCFSSCCEALLVKDWEHVSSCRDSNAEQAYLRLRYSTCFSLTFSSQSCIFSSNAFHFCRCVNCWHSMNFATAYDWQALILSVESKTEQVATNGSLLTSRRFCHLHERNRPNTSCPFVIGLGGWG